MAERPDLARAVLLFRARVNAVDDAARRDLLAAYAAARAGLVARVDAFVAAADELDDATPGAVQRLDRYRDLIAQIEAEMARLGAIGEGLTRRGQTAAVAMAGANARALALAAAGDRASIVAAAWNRLPAAALTDLVGRMKDGSALREWRRELAPAVREKVERGLVEGLARGAGLREVADGIVRQTDLGASRVLLTARNEILGAYRSATLATYAANGDVLDGWVWTAAHDERTCPACLALDGREFSLSQDFMPTHGGCRCSPAPSPRGVPWGRETGEEWLARQPEAVQDRVLRPDGAAAWRAGEVALADFVRLERDRRWGDAYRADGLAGARRRAERRGRRAA